MKEKLIAYFNRQMRYMDINPDGRTAYFSQAFGALDFALQVIDNWEQEDELINLWNQEWKPKFEAKVFGK